MKTILEFFTAIIAFFTLTTCLAILLDDKEYEFQPYEGPFPTELPAGHCLMTDGEKWTTRGYDKIYKGIWTIPIPHDTQEEAIEFAWQALESDRKHLHAPEKNERRNWKLANPELCKEETK